MPKSAKFLKDLLSNQKELEEALRVVLNEQFSTAIMQEIPTKMKDLGCLTIPCDLAILQRRMY